MMDRTKPEAGMGGPNRTGVARNRWFLVAGGLFFAFGVGHLTATPGLMGSVHASALPPDVILLVDVVWNNVSVMMFGSAIVLVGASGRPAWRRPAAWVLAAWCCCGALLFVGFGFFIFGNMTTVPNWIGFVVVGAAVLIALWRDGARDAT
ncbi:hypothetical protein [Devosia sp. LC5]|uniref:hypothetical protein n=1 Tax=Devosia sp. LC5 TaxID=1502724 RepID=UPI00126852EE|nr:hypothetical protein [Devosia sp. LC5]